MNCYNSIGDKDKQSLLDKLKLAQLMKVNGKWKMIFKTESNFAEIVEILKLIPRVLQHNSVNLPVGTSNVNDEICQDRYALLIIAQTLVMIQFDRYQNCKDWSEEKAKKLYTQLDKMIVNIYDALLSSITYTNSIKDSNLLVYHIVILALLQYQARASSSEKSTDFVNSILSSSPSKDVQRALLFLLRQTMCSDITSLVKTYSIYETYYSQIQVDTLEQKFYWYPLKVVILNLIHNLDNIKAQEESCDELLLCKNLMQLLVARDEYALMETISIVFSENETLKTFFLGY